MSTVKVKKVSTSVSESISNDYPTSICGRASVFQRDAIEFLSSLPDESVDLIDLREIFNPI